MSVYSNIQWCDSTLNPAMGCDGCELFPTVRQLIRIVERTVTEGGLALPSKLQTVIEREMESKNATEVYHSRRMIADTVLRVALKSSTVPKAKIEALARSMADEFRCYAAILHLRHGKDLNKPNKRTNKGYAPIFEQVTKFPGRMAAAAIWKDIRGECRPEKPWLHGARRLIFLSDMGDLLSKAIDFEYIRDEVISNVTSPAGSRHIWLWLTKRPARMAKFSAWLEDQGIRWPDGLIAMGSVTSEKSVGRVAELKKIRCRYRGLLVEPLWGRVNLPLHGVDWVIVGGESGGGAKPFHLDWAREIQKQCKAAGVAFFVKQLGARPVESGVALKLSDCHGGVWNEWPKDLRVREIPAGFRE